jgi:hypothetical protein
MAAQHLALFGQQAAMQPNLYLPIGSSSPAVLAAIEPPVPPPSKAQVPGGLAQA